MTEASDGGLSELIRKQAFERVAGKAPAGPDYYGEPCECNGGPDCACPDCDHLDCIYGQDA